MGGGGGHRREGDKVEPQPDGLGQLLRGMAGGTELAPLEGVATVQRHQALCAQVQGRGTDGVGLGHSAVEDQAGAGGPDPWFQGLVEPGQQVRVCIRVTQHDQPRFLSHRLADPFTQSIDPLGAGKGRQGAGDQQSVRQTGGADDGPIGGGKGVVIELCGSHPADRLPFPPLGLAVEGRYPPDIEQHGFVRILVTDADQGPGAAHLDAQLFVQLPGQRLLGVFSRLHFATGELPESTLVLFRSPTGDQYPAGGIEDHRGGHMEFCHAGHLSCGSPR